MLFKLIAMLAASNSLASPIMDGARLEAGSTCYAITMGGKQVGTTLQTITATHQNGTPAWDIVVHQQAFEGSFDMRDRFILEQDTLLPLSMESRRGSDRSARGWHRIAISYEKGRVRGVKETAQGREIIDVPIDGQVWDGNLWGLTFAALPLREGGVYAIPTWHYDKGFGVFKLKVSGTREVETPSGTVEAWIVELGEAPDEVIRYLIAKDTRQELGYEGPEGGQHIVQGCD